MRPSGPAGFSPGRFPPISSGRRPRAGGPLLFPDLKIAAPMTSSLPAALAAALLVAPPAADDDPPPPPLTAAEADRDLGRVAEGGPLTAAFRLVNGGGGAVDFTGATAGCSCQSVEGLPDTLAAGDAATVMVAMKTRGRVGRQRGWWELAYRDAAGADRTLRLTVTATVTAAGKLAPAPPVMQLGAAELGDPLTGSVTLAEVAPSGAAVRVRSVEAPDWLSVRAVELSADPPRWRLEFAGVPPAAPGRFAAAVRVHTDHPVYSALHVPFEGFVRGRAEVTPRSLVQIVGGASARPAVATVRGRGGAAVSGVSAALLDAEGGGDPAPLPDRGRRGGRGRGRGVAADAPGARGGGPAGPPPHAAPHRRHGGRRRDARPPPADVAAGRGGRGHGVGPLTHRGGPGAGRGGRR